MEGRGGRPREDRGTGGAERFGCPRSLKQRTLAGTREISLALRRGRQLNVTKTAFQKNLWKRTPYIRHILANRRCRGTSKTEIRNDF